MTMRTTKKSMTFTKPFVLASYDETLPAGTYDVEEDEELLQGLSFPAYRRVSTVIFLPAKSEHGGISSMLTIGPDELDAALDREREAAATASASRKADRAEGEQEGVNRAEDEGSYVRSCYG